MRSTPLDLVHRMKDIKNPRGLFALKEAIRKADPAIEVALDNTNYAHTLMMILRKDGCQTVSRVVQGEVPFVVPDTGERWYKAYDLLGVEEYDSAEEYDEMRAKVVAELVELANRKAGAP